MGNEQYENMAKIISDYGKDQNECKKNAVIAKKKKKSSHVGRTVKKSKEEKHLREMISMLRSEV